MKILVVTPYLPTPPDFGGARRMYELIRAIGRRHETITLSLAGPAEQLDAADGLGRLMLVPVPATARMPPGRSKRVEQVCSLLSPRSFQDRFYRHPAMQRAIERIVVAEGIDLVQLEFSQMGGYRVPSDTPTVLDVHNVEHDVLRQVAAQGSPARRLFNLIEARKFRREELAAWRRAIRCLATSDADAAAIERATGRAAWLVPNGVDTAYFQRQPLDVGDPARLIFIGAMRYQPNADAVRFFVERVLPLVREQVPDARLAIVGADPPPSVAALGDIPGVEVTGTVPDVRPWLRQAGIVVVPLQVGGGTRLKILEAFAAGRPVVSTTLGATGIAARHEEHLLLADSPESFALATVHLMRAPELRARLVERAYDLVRRRYEWAAIGDDLARRYESLIP